MGRLSTTECTYPPTYLGDGHVVHFVGTVRSTCLWDQGALPIGST